jgi:hypothetical protein
LKFVHGPNMRFSDSLRLRQALLKRTNSTVDCDISLES